MILIGYGNDAVWGVNQFFKTSKNPPVLNGDGDNNDDDDSDRFVDNDVDCVILSVSWLEWGGNVENKSKNITSETRLPDAVNPP